MSLDDDFAMKVAMDIEQEREALIDLCARLIAEPTMNPSGRTMEVASVLQGFLADRGVQSERFAFDEETANIVASLVAERSGRHRHLQRPHGYDAAGRRGSLDGTSPYPDQKGGASVWTWHGQA